VITFVTCKFSSFAVVEAAHGQVNTVHVGHWRDNCRANSTRSRDIWNLSLWRICRKICGRIFMQFAKGMTLILAAIRYVMRLVLKNCISLRRHGDPFRFLLPWAEPF